jgi:hypothetical protein
LLKEADEGKLAYNSIGGTIDQECDVARVTQAPTSPDGGEFQKAQIRIFPNNQRSTLQRVFVVSANDPPRVGTTDSEEARRIQANENHG